MNLAPDLILLGANACVKLNLCEDATTWCDKGLAVSFLKFDLSLNVNVVFPL